MHVIVILIGVALMGYFLLFAPPKLLLQEPISDLADWLIGIAVSVVWVLMFILLAALWYSQYPDPDFGKPTSQRWCVLGTGHFVSDLGDSLNPVWLSTPCKSGREAVTRVEIK